jgi:Zn-dependent peptidase ImmA (M78 family)
MEEIQNWAREYMINSGFGSLNIVGIYKDNFDINYIAKGARETLGLDIHWYENYKDADSVFKFIRKALEKIGIFVLVNGKVKNNTHRPLSLNEFRAFSLIDDYAPLIFINGKDTKNGKVFSLIHEYIHILIGIENLLNDKYGSFYNESINNNDLHVNDQYKKIELLCNAVTSEILVPSEIFCNRWDKSNEIIRNIETLSKYFNCSKFVITIKAFKEKMIDYKTYSQIYKKLIDEYEDIIGKKTKSSGGDFYNASSFGIDHRFFKMLNQSVFEGNTTYTYAFHLTNFSSKTFFEMEKKIMGGSQ